MNPMRRIRDRLNLSQGKLGPALGVDPSNISNYERGKCEVPPPVAKKLIALARTHGLRIDYNHVYGLADLPPEEAPATDVPKTADLPREPAAGTKVPRRPGRPVVYSGS